MLSLASPVLTGHARGELLLPESLARYADGASVSVPVRAKGQGGASLRLRLDRTAPPGRYQAQLMLDGKANAVQIDIAAAPRIEIFPKRISFSGAPGESVRADLTVANTGNVAIDLPARFAVGLFDDDGLETAFVETYRRQTDDPTELMGTWLRSLRDGYAGLLKLRAKGSGTLSPEDERDATLSTRLPAGVKPGHSYHGIWKIGATHFRICVDVRR